MIPIHLRLEYSAKPTQSECSEVAYLVQSDRPEEWLAFALETCEDILRCTIWQLPISARGWVLILFPANLHRAKKSLQECGYWTSIAMVPAIVGFDSTSNSHRSSLTKAISSNQIWIPQNSRLIPVPFAEDWPVLLDGTVAFMVWHPAFGLIELGPSLQIRIEELFASDEVLQNRWQDVIECTSLPDHLLRVDAGERPTLEQWTKGIEKDPSHVREYLQKLPPSKKERRGEPLRNLGKQAKAKAAGWLTGLFQKWSKSKSEKPAKPRPNQTSSTQHGASQQNPASSTAGNNLPGLSWISSIKAWASEAIKEWDETLEARRNVAVERLLEMLDRDPQRGLDYAIPLADSEPSRGMSMPGSQLVYRDWMQSGGGSGPADPWQLSSIARRRLVEKYLLMAKREIETGNYHRAAMIHMKLLGDFRQAAQVFEQGKLYREAAEIYLDRIDDPLRAAGLFRLAGDFDEAIRIYKQHHAFGQAAELERSLGRETEAVQSYRRQIDFFKASEQWCEAADVYLEKLADPPGALDLLEKHWMDGTNPGRCFKKSMEIHTKNQNLVEAAEIVKRFGGNLTTTYFGNWPADSLAVLSREHTDEGVRNLAHDQLLKYVSLVLESNHDQENHSGILSSWRNSTPSDRLLYRHTMSYSEKRRVDSRALIVPPRRAPRKSDNHIQPLRTISLANYRIDGHMVDWRAIVPLVDDVVCIGAIDRDLVVSFVPKFANAFSELSWKHFRLPSTLGPSISENEFDINEWVRSSVFNNYDQTRASIFLRMHGPQSLNDFSTKELNLGRTSIQLHPVGANVIDCFLSNEFADLTAPSPVPSLMLMRDHGKVVLRKLSADGTVHPMAFDVISRFRELLIEHSEIRHGLNEANEEQLTIMIDALMTDGLWRIASCNDQYVVSSGPYVGVFRGDRDLYNRTMQEAITSIVPSNRFTRPRVLLTTTSRVEMQWLKADEFRKETLEDALSNPRTSFLVKDQIGIAHADGLIVYRNSGYRLERVGVNTNIRAIRDMVRDNETFWTLTENELQNWAAIR